MVLIFIMSIGFLFILGFFDGNKVVVSSDVVKIGGGKFRTNDPVSGKSKIVRVNSFLMDKNLVTVSEYHAFSKATGYVTEAEKFGNSGIFDFEGAWRIMLDGAYYLYPFGIEGYKGEPNHPVTMVSWNDVVAYAEFKGKRLPTQWEWEWAAKNGESHAQRYIWGENFNEGNSFRAKVWQGRSTYFNTAEHDLITTCPVGYLGANRLGINDMGGNVWEWCQDDIKPAVHEALTDSAIHKVIHGGSFLYDHDVYDVYQVTDRASSKAESGKVHIGFRCVKDI